MPEISLRAGGTKSCIPSRALDASPQHGAAKGLGSSVADSVTALLCWVTKQKGLLHFGGNACKREYDEMQGSMLA